MSIQGLVFDLDNTLYDADKAYVAALTRIGISSDQLDASRQRVKARLGRGHPSGRNRLLYLKCYLEAHKQFSPKKVITLMAAYEDALIHEVREQWRALKRDALFEDLASRYQLAIVTNENTRTQLLKLLAIDPDGRFFPYVVTSEEVGIEKPNPRIFEEVLRLLLLPASRCAFIGDNYQTDIGPSHALGFRSFITYEFCQKSQNNPLRVRTLTALSHLPDALRSQN